VTNSERETATSMETNAVVQMLIIAGGCLAVLLVMGALAAAYIAFRRKVLWPIYVTIDTMRDMAAGITIPGSPHNTAMTKSAL
jgi:methyl-accepting chemotaxis protein